eukprot:GHVP01029209.1.p1 GENE.GHVP01029209.1~~GHVP01029209.1.p1  ORF type:complete len:121 (+),score=0.09 GHVP01029209.1:124-486(+)
MSTHPEKLKATCMKLGIPQTGVLAITVQRNRTTEFSSVICNFDDMSVATHYPIEFVNSYKEGSIGNLLYAYQSGLDPSKICTDAPPEDAAVDARSTILGPSPIFGIMQLIEGSQLSKIFF